jgi:hypothetical protein
VSRMSVQPILVSPPYLGQLCAVTLDAVANQGNFLHDPVISPTGVSSVSTDARLSCKFTMHLIGTHGALVRHDFISTSLGLLDLDTGIAMACERD